MNRFLSKILAGLMGALITALFTNCSNSILGKLSGTLGPIPLPTVSGTTGPQSILVISSVNINASGSVVAQPSSTPSNNSNALYSANIFFDTSKSTTPADSHCNLAGSSGQSSKPCICQFTWAEINPNSGTGVATHRKVQTAVTEVQPNLIVCEAPAVYASEILNGTQITIQVLPASNNPDASKFSVKPFLFTKSSSTIGSFQDAQGHIFDNVVHYSCYQQYQRGLSIQPQSTYQPLPLPSSSSIPPAQLLSASTFCYSASSGASSSSERCPNLGGPSNSAQAYYFNLYIRNTEKGDINGYNEAFVCPQVQEPINISLPAPIGNTNQYWPMDMTFALSIGPTSDFTIGVEANTKLGGATDPTTNKGDPVNLNSSCYPSNNSSSSAAGSKGITRSCLGFAALPASDGTCPYIKSASGQQVQTFRLRRYFSIYPRLFDTNGSLSPQSQEIDTIYVLDRPVATSAGTNSLKPYTMLGPKPCPFAFFDRKNVTVNPAVDKPPYGYRATNDSHWKTGDGTVNWSQSWSKGQGNNYNNGGTNVDGLEFPNYDYDPNTSNPSCSAIIPFLSQDQTRYYFATVNKTRSPSTPNPAKFNHLYIRPFQPFTPHYEEDTSFLACAPQASPFRDPPLHFAPSTQTSNGVPIAYAWCAENYPTQNPNIYNLDPPVTPTSNPTTPTGTVSNYTSHLSTLNGAAPSGPLSDCIASTITIPNRSYSYPAPGANSGYAQHSSSTTWGQAKWGLGTNAPFDTNDRIGNASQTCDRTVVTTSDVSWTNYPLLAPAADVEHAIGTDSSYNCTITYDNNTGKTATSTSSGQSPSGGCCKLSGMSSPPLINGPTHIEPLQATCLPPDY